ncbi:rapamycin-insensitive companion of mTOR-like isoform X2 [Artemia franciscana]|uniref:rapamycin-insensitive companion of mTOR-like isoform X2 n=1 Tax=Artemia franciscana TaxID=6661 RepID=UPI0032DAF3B8
MKGIRFRQKEKHDGNSANNEKEESEALLDKDIHNIIEDCLYKLRNAKENSSPQFLGIFSVLSTLPRHSQFSDLNDDELCKIYNRVALVLLHKTRTVRICALRLLRSLLRSPEHANTAVNGFLPMFLTRYVDLSVSSSSERGHALRLVRRILYLLPNKFPLSIAAALATLAAEGNCFLEGKNQKKDQLWRVSLAVLQELAVLSPDVFVNAGGVRAAIMAISELNEARAIEAVLLSVLNLYDVPYLRDRMHFKVEQLCAPFTEFFFSPLVIHPDKEKQAVPEWRDRKKTTSLQAILTLIRSWPGLLAFGSPGLFEKGGHFSSLVQALKIPNLDTRKKILDLLDQIFRLDTTFWTDEVSVALKVRYRPRESWKLQTGFVAEEGKDMLPSLSRNRADLVTNHLAIVVYCLVEANLADALVEVIKTSDSVVSVRATVLLGEFFYLIYHYLPPVSYSTSICLSNLMDNLSEHSNNHLAHLQRAIQTSEALGQYQSKKFRPLGSVSPQLRQIIHFVSVASNAESKPPCKLYGRNTARLRAVIKYSRVCLHEDHLSWDWTLVCAVLTWPSDSFRLLEDSYYRQFIRNLVTFYKPSKNQFCSYEYGTDKARWAATAGCLLVDFLMTCAEGETDHFAVELIEDIRDQLRVLLTSISAHDCMFSPAKMVSSACRDCFLLIGRFSSSIRGLKLLELSGILQDLLRLVTTLSHECYTKLVLSTLNFTLDGFPRTIFNRVISFGSEQARNYAVQLLRTYLRAWRKYGGLGKSTFPSWAVGHLINRLDDRSYQIKKATFEVLDETCDDPEFLTTVMEFHHTLSAESEKYASLLVRFLSNPNGLRYLQQSGFLKAEIERWNTTESERYVARLELGLCESLSQHQKDERGAYGRVSDEPHTVRSFPVPNHLYGELGKHGDGVEYLRKYGNLRNCVEAIDKCDCCSDQSTMHLKSALWTVGHIGGASSEGLRLVQSHGDVLLKICRISSSCRTLSVRGTAFYALCLIARTSEGAEALKRYGWIAVRHDHHEQWPIVSEDEWELVTGYETIPSELSGIVSERNRTTSQCSDKSVSFADEIDFIEALDVHVEEESETVKWDTDSLSTSTSNQESIEKRKFQFFPLRKKANTLPRTVPSTPVIHRRTQSMSEGGPSRILKVIRESFRSRRKSMTRNDSLSDISTPGSSVSSSFTMSSFKERWKLFRHSKSYESTSPTMPVTSEIVSTSVLPPSILETTPLTTDVLVNKDEPSLSSELSTSVTERLKQKRSAFFADLEVTPVSMSEKSELTEKGTVISAVSDKERKELEFSLDMPKFLINSASAGGVVQARKQSILELPKQERYEHLSRVGSTLSQLRSSQYKTKQVLLETSNSILFMSLCLPARPELLFPFAEDLQQKDDEPSKANNVEVLNEEGVEEHKTNECFSCKWKIVNVSADDGSHSMDRSVVRNELLSLVTKIGTGIGLNAHEEGLLRLKQAYPWCFQDACFYYDVYSSISTRTYHLRSRRFLQELFIDLVDITD